jgi:hypothetical protein
MIVRDGRSVIDYGPAHAAKRNTVPAGMLVRPGPTGRVPKARPPADPNYTRDWKRRKRANDPEWRERAPAKDREYRRRRSERERAA